MVDQTETGASRATRRFEPAGGDDGRTGLTGGDQEVGDDRIV